MNRHIRSILPGLVTWLVAACVLVGWMASTASAQGDEQAPPDPQGIDVDIKGGTKRELIPMAIAPTQASGPGAERIAREVEQTLRTDMDLAGYFKVLSNDGLFFDPDDEELGAEAINFQNWSNVGARALIKSQVKAQEGGKYELVMHLYVVDKGKLQLEESFASTTSEKGHTAAAHEFANKVLAYYTGKEGVFGTRIAFVRRNKAGLKQIWVTDMSGQSVRAITRNNAINLLPSWGKGSLYYTSYQDQNPDLWAWSNGRHRKLSGRRGQNSGAAYCGGKLALTLSMGGENTDIYLIDPESGKQLQRLTDHWAIDTSPTWSPDCSKIAFVSGRSASPSDLCDERRWLEPAAPDLQGHLQHHPGVVAQGRRHRVHLAR